MATDDGASVRCSKLISRIYARNRGDSRRGRGGEGGEARRRERQRQELEYLHPWRNQQPVDTNSGCRYHDGNKARKKSRYCSTERYLPGNITATLPCRYSSAIPELWFTCAQLRLCRIALSVRSSVSFDTRHLPSATKHLDSSRIISSSFAASCATHALTFNWFSFMRNIFSV